MAHDAGKGSKPRPYSIPQEEYVNRLDAIFKRQREERTAELACPVCSGAMHTQENWKFYYCNNADCNGSIHKG
jgi:hypothetical protein